MTNGRNYLAPIGETFNSLMNWADSCFTDTQWPIINKPLGVGTQLETLGWKCFEEMGKTRAYYKDSNYLIEVSVGKASDKDISLTARTDHDLSYLDLTVNYTRKNEETKATYQYQETQSYNFMRSFLVPPDVDRSVDPTAELKNGVLTITFTRTNVPVVEDSKKIEIKKI